MQGRATQDDDTALTVWTPGIGTNLLLQDLITTGAGGSTGTGPFLNLHTKGLDTGHSTAWNQTLLLVLYSEINTIHELSQSLLSEPDE